MKKMIVTTFVAAALSSCGAANFNRIFGSTDNSTSALLERAQMAYDTGDFDRAEELATQAMNGTVNNGEAAVLLGNIMLSKAGVDVFQVVAKLSELSSPSKTAVATTSTDGCTSSTTSSDAAGTLSTLSCKLLSISTDEASVLGTTVALNSTYFAPVTSYYKPNDITDAIRQAVNVLKYTDRGIRYLCPFINRSKVTGESTDSRHTLENCGDKSGTTYNYAKAHIAFGLLHLIETLVYQRGILVDGVSSSSGNTGIATLSTKINAANFGTDISGFLTAVTDFKTAVDNIANTSNPNSQISLALDGLLVVATSFGEAGIPAKIISTITGSLTKIKETASKLATTAGNASSSSTYQAQALKGQINQKYAATIETKMNTVCGTDGAKCDTTQQTQLCTSYTSISEGVDPTKLSKPSWCK